MVHFKITNGVETRRFQVTPGELTFQQLKERINTLFPEATKEASDLVLRYRDAEGDVITLSSDEEFQEVLSDLPENHVWKLHISSPAVKRQQREARPSLLHHVLETSQWPSFNLRRHPVSEVEELIDLLFGFPEAKSAGKDTATAESKQQSQGREDAEPKSPEDDAEGSSSNGAGPKEGKEEEEVKSKQSRSDEEERAKESHPKSPAGHCCRVKRVGLLDPFPFGDLFGPSRVFGGPVGYHITWAPRSCNNSTCTTGSAACA